MQNVAPSHALVRRSRQLLVFAFLIVSAGVFLAVVGLAMFVFVLAPRNNDTFPTIGRIIFLIGVAFGIGGLAMAVRAVTWRTDNDLAKITGDFLAEHFDERFTFIRNISKIGLGYIDAVLVGPPGVLVFRILDNEGVFFNEASKWLTHNRHGEWMPMRFDPTAQIVADIKHLRQFLEKRKLSNIPVYGVIVFIRDVALSADKPTVPPAQLLQLLDNLSTNYLAKEQRIDGSAVRGVVKVLLG